MKSFKASKTVWGTITILVAIIGVQSWVIFGKNDLSPESPRKIPVTVENNTTDPNANPNQQDPLDFWAQDDFFNTDPFQEMEKMHQRMRKMMDLAMADAPGDDWFGTTGNPTSIQPQVDLKDKGNYYEIRIRIPGVDEPEIKTELSGNQMTISSILDQSKEKKDDQTGHFSRSVTKQQYTQVLSFPEAIDPATLESEFKDKALVLTIQKLKN